MNRQVVMLIVFGVSVTAALLGIEFAIDHSNRPPEWVRNIDDFDDWYEGTMLRTRVTVDGAQYTVVFGKEPLFPIKERPAGYVFDESGELIHWSREIADADRLSKYWDAARGFESNPKPRLLRNVSRPNS